MIEAVKTLLSIVWNGFFKSVRLPFLNNMSLATFVISIFIIDLLIVVLKWLILGDISFGIGQARASAPKETHSETITYNENTGKTNHTYSKTVSRTSRKKRR